MVADGNSFCYQPVEWYQELLPFATALSVDLLHLDIIKLRFLHSAKSVSKEREKRERERERERERNNYFQWQSVTPHSMKSLRLVTIQHWFTQASQFFGRKSHCWMDSPFNPVVILMLAYVRLATSSVATRLLTRLSCSESWQVNT